uniref:Prolyl 4-hydroxylase alpha subunit Fe(2+) 2OG dioxygenase domain-containing protein n=1 Tax=viral metagenome TaxID=1070528 RepID=A0A6C0J978_9ZZZZ
MSLSYMASIVSKYIILNNIFPHLWCNPLIDEFNKDHDVELILDTDRYGRYNFVSKKLSLNIYDILNQYIDLSLYKISHKFYMNKYWPNSSSISKHVDGQIDNSTYSVIIYLNTCIGGETIIYNSTTSKAIVKPEIGRVLLDQNVVHEAVSPTTFKYILRTDLIKLSPLV